MRFDADVTACAGLVQTGDPDRFRTVMAAPSDQRAVLFVLYALNVEVSRAPWVTQEAMIAEMRLQWWRDVMDEIAKGRPVRRHDVASPLAKVLAPDDAERLDAFVAARRWDIYREPFEDAAHFDAYIDETAGHLMWTAARLSGASDETGIRHLAYAAGVAGFLRAVPALEDAGRIPLLDGTHAGLRDLAQRGLDRLALAPRQGAVPALWPAIGAGSVLRQVLADPAAVADNRLRNDLSALRLAKASLFGRL